jgi:hypothetical protein
LEDACYGVLQADNVLDGMAVFLFVSIPNLRGQIFTLGFNATVPSGNAEAYPKEPPCLTFEINFAATSRSSCDSSFPSDGFTLGLH